MIFIWLRSIFLLYLVMPLFLFSMENNKNKQAFMNSETEYVLTKDFMPEMIDLSLLDEVCWEQDFFGDKKLRGLFFRYKPEIIKTVYKGYFTKRSYFRGLHRYIPDNRDRDKKTQIDYFFVHGTYAGENPEYYDENNVTYRGFLEYVASIAKKYGVIADIYSYCWSGENSDEARMEGSSDLVKIVNALPLHHELGALGHSNGGNIIWGAANQLINGRTFREGIAIAAPTFEAKHYSYAIHNVINTVIFLSRADWIRDFAHLYAEYTGNTCDKYAFCRKRGKENPFDEKEKMYIPCDKGITHIWVTDDDHAPNHCGLSALLSPKLAKIMKLLYRDFIGDEKIRGIIHNMALNIIAKSRQKKERVSLSLYERTEEDAEAYKKLPKEIFDLSENNRKKHQALYGNDKNNMTFIYKFLKGGYNVLKDIGIC